MSLILCNIILVFSVGENTTVCGHGSICHQTRFHVQSLYCLHSIVVGTRGQRGMMQALGAPGVGSMLKYCLSIYTLLIVVVCPERI
ncbi:hypothetical protein C8R48DRAFT_727055 [Suillus tomentosus]|nr:hypothetical protein C8R48DRAFT_727055 [Suillus tomentosus]